MKYFLILIFLLVACDEESEGIVAEKPAIVVMEKSENDIEVDEIKTEIVTVFVPDEQVQFTSTWAKTDTHLFFTNYLYPLYRAPLDNIAQIEEVILPNDGEIRIVGIDEPYIFVARHIHFVGDDWTRRHYNTYRLCIVTLEATLVDSGIYLGAPTYHKESNSLLFASLDLDSNLVWLESLQLDTGIRDTFFESEYSYGFEPAWWRMEGGYIIFTFGRWSFALIDSDLQARRAQHTDIIGSAIPPEPAPNAVENYTSEGWTWHFTQIDDWVYYIWRGVWHEVWREGDLYRVKVDGTQKELLQTEIDFMALYSFNGILFARICREYDENDFANFQQIVKLAEDGNITKVLEEGWHTHNSSLLLTRLLDTDIIKIIESTYHQLDYFVLGVFCLETKELSRIPSP